MYPEPKYKQGDVVELMDRVQPTVTHRLCVVCGLCYKGEYSLMELKDYIFYMLELKDEVKCPRRIRLAVDYLDKTAKYIGSDLESIRILYG